MSYRYDQLQMSTTIPNFINLGVVKANLSCSGTIANGGGANFTSQSNINTFSTFNDIKLTNQNTGNCTYLTGSSVAIDNIWQYKTTETVQNSVTFIGTLVTVEISVSNNTGSSVTLVSQVYTVEIIQYQLPF
jgi:hypothetical protein